MTLGVIGTKLGMTQIYDETGLCIPVTVVAVEKAVVTQVKTKETDGYEAIQVGVVVAKEKHLTKAQIGHFKKNNLENFRHLQEFRVEDASKFEVGQAISLEEVLANVQKVDVTGRSIGKGFQGFLPPPDTSALVFAQAKPARALFNCLLRAKYITCIFGSTPNTEPSKFIWPNSEP